MDDLFDIANRNRVDAGKRFVQQDELGRGGQCASNFHTTTLATGQAHAKVVANVVDVELLQQVFQLRATAIPVKLLASLQDRHDVVGDREFAEDRRFLRKIADTGAGATVHRLVADVQIVNQHAALVRLNQADDHVETGGLAGTVGAEQADDLAAVNRQADIAHDLTAFIGLGQMLGFQGCHYSAFFFGWITMSMRGRGALTLVPLARPAWAT